MPKITDIPEHEMTGVNTHVATHRGYAHGRIIEPGEFVPHEIAVADEWMTLAEAGETQPEAEEAPAE